VSEDSDFSALRREYSATTLDERDVARDPVVQLQRWLDEALTAGVLDVTAMSVCTVSPEGAPSSRIVLLKKLSPDGLTFFTRKSSQKGREIEHNPQVALLFHWRELNRQVRISGSVSHTSQAEARSYFDSRPRDSRLAARVASGRQVVADRATLERLFAEQARDYPGDAVPMPDDWGGYCVHPSEFEFWQGREGRLHDRVSYRRDESGNWQIARLAP
jgi:pyridoxamine 5'-phosphate oxidase